MKKVVTYDKLVRDKIPENLEKRGITVITRTATDKEYITYLKRKLEEEVFEFLRDSNEEELADVLEVIKDIIRENGFTEEQIEMTRKKKLEEKGGFRKKLILERTEE